MPFVKDSLSLLIEAGAVDINNDTKSVVRESTIRKGYNQIESVSEEFIYGPEMVPVVSINNELFTEMNFLKPYMDTNGIRSISEALNNVAEANGLSECSVGLLIESDGGVDECISKALESGSPKKKENVFDKIGKAIDITDTLKKKGIKVKKKASAKKKKKK